jgi:hypothetical protein
MPVPDELQKSIYHEVGQYNLDIKVTRSPDFGKTKGSPYHPDNPNYDAESVKKRKTTSTKTFIAYLEVGMQAKHDKKMQVYCMQNNIEGRRTDGTQCPNTNSTNPFAFYQDKGLVASEVVSKITRDKWAKSGVYAKSGSNSTVFVPGSKNMPGVQSITQRDGYAYDISFWYMGHEVYVAFHCHPDT